MSQYHNNLRVIDALGKSTENKLIVPEVWRESNGVLIGKRGKVHTILCGVPVPSIKAEYERRVIDPRTGQDIKPRQEGECHSWCLNHYNWVVSSIAFIDGNGGAGLWEPGKITSKDTAGTIRSTTRPFCLYTAYSCAPGNSGYAPPVATSTFGIQLGTGTTAVNVDTDYKIETQIAHGVGANQLYYATTPPDVYTYAGTTLSHTKTRYFDNFSGAQISASEMALVCQMYAPGALSVILVAREIISPALDIPNLAQAKISYTFSLDFSSPVGLRNIYNLIFGQIAALNSNDATYEDGKLSFLDTGNTIRKAAYPFGPYYNSSTEANNYGYVAAAGVTTTGPVFGSNSTAVNFSTDYALNTLIAHGTGAGQLNYAATEALAEGWVDPVYTASWARTASNGSGGNVTVRETGGICRTTSQAGTWPILMRRDVFSDVVVANGESIRVVYQFQVTYP